MSLLSGAAIGINNNGPQEMMNFNPQDLLANNSAYEPSESSLSSCSPCVGKFAFKAGGSKTGGSSGGAEHTNHSSCMSAVKAGMRFAAPDNVEEVSSDSDDDVSDSGIDDEESDQFEFNPKQFYWIFNPVLKFTSRTGFSVEDDINP